MNKKICNIVLDLLPEYIENDVSKDTKEFVDEHIKECANCKKTLDGMQNDIIEAEDKLKNDTEIEIKKIQKVGRGLKVRKIVLTFSSIIVCIIAVILLTNQIHDKFNKTFYDEIKENYSKNMKMNNYHLSKKEVYKNYSEPGSFELMEDIYYKDAKYKIYENFKYMNNPPKETIKYGEIESGRVKEINTSNNTTIEESKKTSYEEIRKSYETILDNFKNVNMEDLETRSVEEKEWYVYRIGKDEEVYTEYWIDKENLRDIKYFEFQEKYCRETVYLFEKDSVTDSQIRN